MADDGLDGALALDVAGLELAVGSGQYCEKPGYERVDVLDVGRPRPRLLWDGHVLRARREQLLEGLRQRARALRVVELDTMARTRWRLMWTIDEGEFVLWDRLGRRAWLDDTRVHRRRRGGIERRDVVGVTATLSEGWLTRGVEMALASGAPIAVARTREVMTVVDPTYDFIDLTCDASWARALTTTLAAAIGVPADVSAYD